MMSEFEYRIQMKQLTLELYTALITDDKKSIKEIQDKMTHLEQENKRIKLDTR